MLIRLLGDTHSMVRFYATLGLRKIRSNAAVPIVIEMLQHEEDDLNVGSILMLLGEVGGEAAQKILLNWTISDDDFHRLDAIEGLCRLGDERVASVASQMLQVNRPPERFTSSGGQSHVDSIATLVAKSLSESPSRAFRGLSLRERESGGPSRPRFRIQANAAYLLHHPNMLLVEVAFGHAGQKIGDGAARADGVAAAAVPWW